MVINNVSKKISYLGIISALLGYVVSYHKFYLFHMVVLFFIFYFLFFNYKLTKLTFNVVKPIFFFLVFSIFSLIWTVDISGGLRNVFYIVCGLFAVLFVSSYTRSIEDLAKIVKLIIFISLINFSIGLCETLGVFRLPMSPYSPYASFFGYAETNFNEFSSFTLEQLLKKPTGFNANPNNFGFVFLIILPFLFFYNKYTKWICLFFLVWFNIYIQSKGFFLSCVVFFLLVFIFYSRSILKYIPFAIIILIFLPSIDTSEYRVFSTFESINIGLDMIKSGDGGERSSTDVRSYIYNLGLKNLLENPLLGLGIGGIQAILESKNFPIQSFHFYFLEMLVNYGFIFYSLFLIFYFRLIYNLFKIGNNINDGSISYIARSCTISLIIMPFASISPSSIVYILSAWLILGVSLTLVYLVKYENHPSIKH